MPPVDRVQEVIRRARAAREGGRLSEARVDLLEAIGLLQPLGNSVELAQTLRLLAEVERGVPDLDAAESRYQEAVAILRRLGDPLPLAHAVRHLGDVRYKAGRTDAALHCYDEALMLYRAHAGAKPLDLANALRSMAILKEAAGEREQASRLWQEAHDLYAAVDVPAGVAESARRVERLSRQTDRHGCTDDCGAAG